jgi:hypothetical protein
MEVASLPDTVKPDTGDEATGTSSRQTFRGVKGQRAGTDQSGTWETRPGAAQVGGNRRRESITAGRSEAGSRKGP